MAAHLVKLCVGVREIAELACWQTGRLAQTGRVFHVTRMTPRRAREIVDGGSIYWVIRAAIRLRQKVIAIEPFQDEEGVGRCRLVFDPQLMLVRPTPRRAFQGWRYLEDSDAPPDIGPYSEASDMPEAMRAELTELALI